MTVSVIEQQDSLTAENSTCELHLWFSPKMRRPAPRTHYPLGLQMFDGLYYAKW